MGRFMGFLVVAGGLCAAGAWYLGLLPTIPGPGGTGIFAPGSASSPNLLGDLYKKEPLPTSVKPQPREGQDPIIVSGNLTAMKKMDACATVPGPILFVGTEIPEGAAQVAGIAPFLQGKIYPATVNQGD